MQKQDTRLMAPEERQAVIALMPKRESLINRVKNGLIALFLTSLASFFLICVLPNYYSPFSIGLSVVLGLYIGLKIIEDQNEGELEEEKKYNNDLKDGKILVFSCKSNAVIEVKEYEERGEEERKINEVAGPSFFLDIGDGKIMFLSGGIYLDQLIKSKEFPNDEFDQNKLPHSGQILSLTCKGNYLAPLRTVESSILFSESNDMLLIYDGDIFPGTLYTLEKDIREFKNSRNLRKDR